MLASVQIDSLFPGSQQVEQQRGDAIGLQVRGNLPVAAAVTPAAAAVGEQHKGVESRRQRQITSEQGPRARDAHFADRRAL